jgi:hypothetical protein
VGDVAEYVVTPPLASGTYTWTVAAYDAVSLTSFYPSAWTFTVDPAHTPQVVGVQPTANSHTATLGTNLTVSVNDTVSPTTVTTRTMSIHGGFHGHLDGGFEFSDIVFNPDSVLYPGELVDVSVTGGIQAGKKSVTPYVWQFRAGVAGGDGLFTSSQLLRAVQHSADVALGDLNGDETLDAVIVVKRLGYPSQVCLNDGTGTLGPSCQSLTTASSNAAALGDLDGDGDLDVFFANGEWDPAKGVANEVWLNQGGLQGGTPGSFARGWTQSTDLSVSESVALGDLDGDGDLDAFIGTSNDETNRVWLNQGDATFSAGWVEGSDPSEYDATYDVALGDLDGDGDMDAWAGNHGLNRVWLNEGGVQGGTMGTFRVGWAQVSDPAQSKGVELGDLDGDGDLDAAVANAESVDVIWRNDGPSKFSRIALSSESLSSQDVTLGDLDGDGDLDAHVTTRFAPDQVWRNEGSLVFTKTQGLEAAIFDPYMKSEPGYGVALGDVDGDGDLDSVVATSRMVAVWLNQDASLPPAGGSVHTAPGVTITVPGGAFTDTVVINYAPSPITGTGSLKSAGFFFELSAAYLSSGEPATLQPGMRYTITVTYDQADVPPGVNESDLALFYVFYDPWGRPVWTKEPTSVVDTVANTITATPNHFSLWGVLESKYHVYLPVSLRSD